MCEYAIRIDYEDALPTADELESVFSQSPSFSGVTRYEDFAEFKFLTQATPEAFETEEPDLEVVLDQKQIIIYVHANGDPLLPSIMAVLVLKCVENSKECTKIYKQI